ncbi:hypothetical protein C8Q79DRAFT_455494 [Trametes meyenii]|nr:hypothetical protein C8Q79DRAFT_455494 [Trametes meyenii]
MHHGDPWNIGTRFARPVRGHSPFSPLLPLLPFPPHLASFPAPKSSTGYSPLRPPRVQPACLEPGPTSPTHARAGAHIRALSPPASPLTRLPALLLFFLPSLLPLICSIEPSRIEPHRPLPPSRGRCRCPWQRRTQTGMRTFPIRPSAVPSRPHAYSRVHDLTYESPVPNPHRQAMPHATHNAHHSPRAKRSPDPSAGPWTLDGRDLRPPILASR